MLELKIDHQPTLQALRNAVQAMNGSQRTALMRNVAASMLAAVEENFAQQGRPRWQALKPRTIAQRRKSGHWPGKILQRTGRLKNSMSQRWTAERAVVGTNVLYAAIHNQGGTISRKPRSQTVRLRTDAKGRLLRQAGHPNLAVFARKRHQRAAERQASIGAHSIDMPQREFMRLTDQELKDLTADVNVWYEKLLKNNFQ